MIGAKISDIETVHDAMRSAPDCQKLALAIELAGSVADPHQAAGLVRLSRVSVSTADALVRERLVAECG